MIAQRLVERQRKAIASLGELLDCLRVCLGVDDVGHGAAGVRDFARLHILSGGFCGYLGRFGLWWIFHRHTGSQHQGADDDDIE